MRGSNQHEAGFDLDDILKSVRETAYRWDFASDRMDFAETAASVLGKSDMAALGKGRAFALMVDPEHAGARYDGITGGAQAAPGTEVRYSLHYASCRRDGAARRRSGSRTPASV